MIALNHCKPALYAVLGATLIACGSGAPEENGHDGTADSLNTTMQDGGGLMKMGGRIFSIPSPVETAMLIRKLGMSYQSDLPLPAEKAEGLTTKTSRSLALGMYGADMAYVTMFKDGQRALTTLQTIEKLGSGLELSNAFDRALIERYKNNLTSEDSLLRMSGEAFRAADRYLKNNERDDVSALVLAGGWIESMYLTLSNGPAENQNLADRVGEQRRTLNDLIGLLEQSDKDKTCAPLIASLKDLQTDFTAITSTYQYEKPVTDPAARITHINSTTKITVSAAQIGAITAKIAAMRTSILA